ncbi:hypothetical protein [Evansella tamaricis]|uniref:ASCH domain-containing protein n=1 Tax=Evansella tamaricis TaxID=2069301 RepID=A0ABS6JCE7_9BACI|nr:hypothetical protein [Evansella tamaricis]MBU9711347.1 hypothetical protein [Evansella tamaricis]
MKVYDYKMEFGWEDHNGIGEKLIQQIIKGEKTATCALKEEYSEQELKEIYESVGKTATVVDKNGNPRCNVRLKVVVETTVGNPDPRLVRGEGYGDNTKHFQEAHRIVWNELGVKVNEGTILIAELFEVVK